MLAEAEHPEEAFPRFREILFDSPQQFAEHASRFLQDGAERKALAAEMRDVVVERFSYESAMKRFLHAMAGYLGKAARANR